VDVVIPVKSSRVKSRLSGVLSEEQRVEFTSVLLSDLLAVVRGAGLISRSHVVSSDRAILARARRLGAGGVLEDRDAGVNQAVRRALDQLGGYGRVLVLPSDLALLTRPELRGLITMGHGVDVVISPSMSFNGTNALLFSPASDFPLSYDDNSFWNHLGACARLSLSVAVCCEEGVMFDVDTPEDLSALSRSRLRRPSVEFAKRVAR
jgi:2-phospho-L-lactate guanylyltransferase